MNLFCYSNICFSHDWKNKENLMTNIFPTVITCTVHNYPFLDWNKNCNHKNGKYNEIKKYLHKKKIDADHAISIRVV